ncbi:SET domain-containing protein [Exidia glandulosa HHB12029]|uniref:SET domain-containing protein n=1 Tax=Exidia glandulosa HHB12029 TaxID=1314781 RepID=A0A165DN76_EXIGL|nr:SET domain-containing protein [Exidia glandulosa HHB12029]
MYSPRREKMEDAYKTAWASFYAWNDQEAERVLRSLDQDEVEFDLASDDEHGSQAMLKDSGPVGNEGLEQPNQGRQLPEPDVSWLQVFSHDACITTRISRPRLHCDTIEAGPRYESCDAIVQRVCLYENERLAYPRVLSFCDDPSFEPRKYLEELAVSKDNGGKANSLQRFKATQPLAERDPNLDVIELETARLTIDAMSDLPSNDIAGEIDGMLVLSRQLQDSKEKRGLVTDCWQREMPSWTDFVNNEDELADIFDAFSRQHDGQNISLRQHFTDFIDSTCFRLPCIEPSCSSHPPPNNRLQDRGKPLDFKHFRAQSKESCGVDCFLTWPVEPSEDVVWAEDELDALALILSQCPNLSSCELAITTDKPCREVYVQRRHLEERNPELWKPRTQAAVVEQDSNMILPERPPKEGEPGLPPFGCFHSGPCDSDDCACFKAVQYCRSSCGCGNRCGRQYPGCDCHPPKKKKSKTYNACRSKNCLCVKLRRECEPGVCRSCESHLGIRSCANVAMGSGMPTKTFVAEGKYGFGLFARDLIPEGAFIGEYTAEILGTSRGQAQDVIGKHIGRGYLFSFCNSKNGVGLDALDAGNVTRFINHGSMTVLPTPQAKKMAPNAEPRELYVNGDITIGVFATCDIRKNQEIFMDYGAEYFGLTNVEEGDAPDQQ